MPYVITEACIGVKDKSCVDVCPVDCIYEGPNMLFIHPDECIDCGACEPECPVTAIFPEEAVTIEGETHHYGGRFFCPRCGSSVFSRSDDEIEVNLGSLDAPDQLKPTYELWTIRRESWLPPFPLTKRFDRDREGTSRFEE